MLAKAIVNELKVGRQRRMVFRVLWPISIKCEKSMSEIQKAYKYVHGKGAKNQSMKVLVKK